MLRQSCRKGRLMAIIKDKSEPLAANNNNEVHRINGQKGKGKKSKDKTGHTDTRYP